MPTTLQSFQGNAADEVAAAIAQAKSATQRIIWDSGAFGECAAPVPQVLPPSRGVSSGLSESKDDFVNPVPPPPLSEPMTQAGIRGQRREPQTISMPPPISGHQQMPPSLASSGVNNPTPVMNQVRSASPPPQAPAPSVPPAPAPAASAKKEPAQQAAEQPAAAQQTMDQRVVVHNVQKPVEASAVSGPKPPAKLDLVSLDGTRPGSVGLRWGGDDNSHLSISRVELQVWSVDRDELLPMLEPGAGVLSITTARLQGCTVAFSHSLNVSFSDPKASSGSEAVDVAEGPQVRAQLLLASQQVAAHVGTASAPAPLNIEGIPRQMPVVARIRLYSNTLSQNERLKAGQRGKAEGQQKNPSKSRCGPWSRPCLLVLLPEHDHLQGPLDLQSAVADEAASAVDNPSSLTIKAWGSSNNAS